MTRTINTTCPYCGTGCGVSVEIGDDGARVSGDKKHPANFGRLCVKGSALAQVLTHEDRLLHPKIDGARASWDAALDLVAQKFSQTIAAHGPDAVAFYLSGQLLTEDYYVANKLMKGFDRLSQCRHQFAPVHVGLRRRTQARLRLRHGSRLLRGPGAADLVVLVGSNLGLVPSRALPAAGGGARQARRPPQNRQIDPRRTATSELADLHLSLAPGSDVALFNGLLRELNAAGKRARKFVGDHTSGAEAALAEARKRTLEKTAEATELSPRELRQFFDLVIDNDKTVTVYSQGVNQSSAGADKVNAIINTHLLTGRIGQPGSGPFSVTGQPNAMGGREVGGLANMLAAHMEIDNHDHRTLVQDFWRSPAIAAKPGLKAVELLRAIYEGQVKAVWIVATNPVDSMPDADFVRAALAKMSLRGRIRCRGKDRHDKARACASAGAGLGREGRHGHQFREAHFPAAGVAQGARRGPRRLAGDLRRGAAHGFRRGLRLRRTRRDFSRTCGALRS